MADDDNFDIDIYGDDAQEFQQEPAEQIGGDIPQADGAIDSISAETDYGQPSNEPKTEPKVEEEDDVDFTGTDNVDAEARPVTASEQPQEPQQQINSTSGTSGPQLSVPKRAPRQQGVKREQGAEDTRETDAGATAALRLGELQWWITEDDIRGWANQCEVENELKEVTFNEHKVNGKSKGSVAVQDIHSQSGVLTLSTGKRSSTCNPPKQPRR